MSLSAEENIQYSRHLLLNEVGIVGQERLKAAKVLVIGAGGLGCPVLQYLTAAGVGTIGIIDHDVVDRTNLQRQILYSLDDVGKNKALCASERLSQLNPFVNFEAIPEQLTAANAIELFQQYAIIVDGSDNFPTRYLVNDTAVITNRPVVFGSIFKFEGQVSVFNHEDGPTYRCLYPVPPAPNEVPNCSEIGVLGVLPGIIGTLQANEVIKLICRLGSVLSGKLLVYDALSCHQTILNYSKSTTTISTLLDQYDTFCGVTQLAETTLEELKASEVKHTLLDVRTNEEHAVFNLGGMHIPLNELADRYAETPLGKAVVVYCQSGQRSAKAIELLQTLDSRLELVNLKGGISGYTSDY